MQPKDEFTLEQRTKMISFLSREPKEYGTIETPGFNDITYRLRYNRPTNKRNGFLDMVFVVPLTDDICIIEAKLEFNKNKELTYSSTLDLTCQPYDGIKLTHEIFGPINALDRYSKGSKFDFAKICYDKINELISKLAE